MLLRRTTMAKTSISFFCRWALQSYRQSLLHRSPRIMSRMIAWCMPTRYRDLLRTLEYWTSESLKRFQGRCIADLTQLEQCIDGSWVVRGWAFGWERDVSQVSIVFDEVTYPCQVTQQERYDVWRNFPAEASLASGFIAQLPAQGYLLNKQIGIQIVMNDSTVQASVTLTSQHLVPSPVVIPGWQQEQVDTILLATENSFVMDVDVPIRRVHVGDRVSCIRGFIAARELLIPDQALLEALEQEAPLLERSGALPHRVVDIFSQKIEHRGLR